jgi:hypothetical protein
MHPSDEDHGFDAFVCFVGAQGDAFKFFKLAKEDRWQSPVRM